MKQYSLRKSLVYPEVETTILNQAKKNNEIIYGAQAIKAQINPLLSRRTRDYDVYSNNSRKSARQLERNLDKKAGYDSYYVKPALHKGTYKVMDKGLDLQSKADDVNVADYSKKKKGIRTIDINGIRYVHVSEIEKDKVKALNDKTYTFRHKKDRSDLLRMGINKRLARYFR